jgi:Cu2+-exporting ATPase
MSARRFSIGTHDATNEGRGDKVDHAIHHVPTAHQPGGHRIAKAGASHDHHAAHSVAMFRDKFWLSFALTIPVVFWSGDVQRWFGYTAPSFPSSKFIAPVLGTIVFLYGGLVFIRGAWNEIADHKPARR